MKRKPIRMPKLLRASKGRSCVNCGRQDETVVRAHYCGVESYRFGKGAGQKADDHVSADLCAKCHREADSYLMGNEYERGFRFLQWCLLTLRRDIEEGVLK